MGVGKQITPMEDLTTTFNNVYQINRDVSGWDKMTVQVVAPVLGAMYVYGSLDSGYQKETTQGNASLAINFTPIQALRLSDRTRVSSISAAGLYTVDAAEQQFVRLQGNPAGTPTNVYRLLIFNSKVQ